MASQLTILLTLDHAVLLGCLLLYALLGLSFFWVLFAHLYYRRQSLAREAAILAAPLPAQLPHILVQLPTFNEGALIKRAAARVGQMDWPRDRLHVQILDDSTDGSGLHAQEAAAALGEMGIDAVALQRTKRAGFKAGAMAEGLSLSRAEYVAILDTDYLPPSDFLALCIRPLLADPVLALVQARCDYLNGGENEITATQQRLLDAHYAIEQPARNWAGQVMPFNGTCGIWRRAALDAAGDWQGDTLAEDMDISYRAQMMGWRALFLVSVAVPGELPRSFFEWRRQQFRWARGSAQVMRKILPAVWRSALTPGQKVGATFHLGLGILGPLSLIVLATAVIEMLFGGGLSRDAQFMIALVAIEMICGPALLQLAGQLLTRRAGLFTELVHIPIVLVLQLVVGLMGMWGWLKAIAGHKTPWVPTAKQGSAPQDLGRPTGVNSP
jgi:cellulose synthase/poly-beta-1,6-N-acetylglucosamine synthase-like glycosyltransferase